MHKPEPTGPERIVYESRLFEIVKQPMRIGEKQLDFETVRRPPGVRLIIVQDGKLLLQKEYRVELNGDDYRLPGGKVFDTIAAYREYTGDLLMKAAEAAKKECEEETGLRPTNLHHFYSTSKASLVEWDLYYFVVEAFEEITDEAGNIHEGELIKPAWKTFAEAKAMCLSGAIQEERSVAVLLRYFRSVTS
ncbi:MAG: NUDIX domain-containing protein [Candidatus Woesearchaeota archaeon]|nr:NUDIX domain-containing protein [Candidatus Woesearchaeota archaeon]